MDKECQRWISYLQNVKIFQSTDNAKRQEALDEQRENNKKVIDACQESRFPIRVLSDPGHSSVFVNACIQGFCDSDMVDCAKVRFPLLKFAQSSTHITPNLDLEATRDSGRLS